MKTKTFAVQGTGPFPIDMLRYDLCHPAREADSSTITRSFNTRERSDGDVVQVTSQKATLTSARWESFGWRVLDA